MRQQRNQDSHAIYRPKETKTDTSPVSTQESPPSLTQAPPVKSNTSTPTTVHVPNSSSSTAATNSPLSPRFTHNSSIKYVASLSVSSTASNGSTESISSTISNVSTVSSNVSGNVNINGTPPITLKSPLRSDKPIQKVTPSRNSTPIKYHQQVTSPTNGNVPIGSKLNSTTSKEYNAYIKPNSPAKPNIICSNGSPATNLNNTSKTNGSTKPGTKTPRYCFFIWNFSTEFGLKTIFLYISETCPGVEIVQPKN